MSLLRTKSIEASIADSEASEFQLKKNLSALDLTFFGIGVVIGAGIFTTAGRAANTMAGPAVVISFIISAFCCALAALCYAELSSTVPVSGSAYTFSYATMGELVAWIVGWDLLLELVLASGVVAQGWSAYFQILFGEWGLKMPAELSSGTTWFGQFDLVAFLLVLVLACLIAVGIKESMRVNLALVALKLLIVFFIIAMGIQYIHTSNYHPFIPPSQTAEPPATKDRPLLELIFNITPHHFGTMGVISAAAVVFFAYIGFDVVATTAEETRNPKRDMPIGIIGSLAICTVLYVAVSLVVTGMVRYDKMDPKGALAAAFRDVGHPGYAQIISAGAVAGLATVVMTLLVGATRVVYAMSRDGLLPIGFAKTSAKTGTPVRMTLGLGLFVALLAGIIPNGEFDEMVNIGTLSAFFLVSIAVPMLRRKRPDLERPFKVPFSPVLPILSALVCLYLMLELPVLTWIRFLVWLAIGFVVFFGWGKWESRVGLGKDGFRAANIEHVDAVENGAVPQATLPAIATAGTAAVGLLLLIFGPAAWWNYVLAFVLAIFPGLVVAHQLTGKARRDGVHTTRYLRSYWTVLGVAVLALLVALLVMVR